MGCDDAYRPVTYTPEQIREFELIRRQREEEKRLKEIEEEKEVLAFIKRNPGLTLTQIESRFMPDVKYVKMIEHADRMKTAAVRLLVFERILRDQSDWGLVVDESADLSKWEK